MKKIPGFVNKTLSALGWIASLGLMGYGAFRWTTDLRRLHPVEIVKAKPLTPQEQRQDYTVNYRKDAFDKAYQRSNKMLKYDDNMALYKAYRGQLDSLKLTTVAQKAFAVDSLVDAQIKIKDDEQLYGEDRWATPVETIQKGSGDPEDLALLKNDLLGYLDVPLKNRFVCVTGQAKDSTGKDVTMMVNLAEEGQPESMVMLDPDSKASLVPVAEKRLTYHIAMNGESLIYILPKLK
jgi:predicted transglutaminase-like cysteine proteinase